MSIQTLLAADSIVDRGATWFAAVGTLILFVWYFRIAIRSRHWWNFFQAAFFLSAGLHFIAQLILQSWGIGYVDVPPLGAPRGTVVLMIVRGWAPFVSLFCGLFWHLRLWRNRREQAKYPSSVTHHQTTARD